MKIFNWAYKLLKSWDFNDNLAEYINLAVNIVVLVVVAYILDYLFKKILIILMAIIAERTKSTFDDFLVANKTAKYVAHLFTLSFVYKTVPIILKEFVYWESFFTKGVKFYIIILSLWIIRSVFHSLKDYLKEQPKFKDKPIDSYIQVIMIGLWVYGIVYFILILFDTNMNKLLATFGAISALIILIFRDTILGFVASIQVTVNDMVRIGDWITMEKYGADGDVIEINLATVKVQNFDNTITTIPTYFLISDSFKNWRGMLDSDGRRLKRSILLKSSSIRFLNDEEIENLKRIQLIKPYLDHRQTDIDKFNKTNAIDKSVLINGRNLTNFGIFRKYIDQYIANHPGINKDMLFMCRQLQPTQNGMPLEIYAFVNDKRLVEYEHIMADIFDHILASVRYFDMEINETGAIKIEY
ncbi:putative transmembrane transport protein [Flavobacterium cauense R2A-7]|uniref:Mechanosensing system component YbdG n=1 Tax=Flavobacterium cauense R2A-7 TaxID=1341154 RepID=V6RWF5_9FLAO|nr:mechanosensitive ion channel domain-containing protein [Flavobacterium cauense]ESU18816.1 putative transmembrane transport protein [Flavobacterium cauense R2A-7]KGO81716.1 mechanosensitive ion channel protein MscS [Flavobacterium cauense R2A-7]TWI13744.1 miniconductance mechanosensitive channel [Flavobacterium cauense R2A-7]